MVDGFAKTPRYVLKDGSYPIRPSVSQASSDGTATVIFGFSDKPEYDVFLSASSLALTPYPLQSLAAIHTPPQPPIDWRARSKVTSLPFVLP